MTDVAIAVLSACAAAFLAFIGYKPRTLPKHRDGMVGVALLASITCSGVQAYRSEAISEQVSRLVNTRMDFFARPTNDFQEVFVGHNLSMNLGFTARDNPAQNVGDDFALFIAQPSQTSEIKQRWSEFLKTSKVELDKPSTQVVEKDNDHWLTVDHRIEQDDIDKIHQGWALYAFIAVRWKNVSNTEDEERRCLAIPSKTDIGTGRIFFSKTIFTVSCPNLSDVKPAE